MASQELEEAEEGFGDSLNATSVDFLVVVMGGPDEHLPNIALGRELESRGYRAGFICQLDHMAALIRKSGLLAKGIAEAVKESGLEPRMSPQLLEKLEERYGLVSFRDLCWPEICTFRLDEPAVYERAIRYLEALEPIFDEWDPSCVVQNAGAELLRQTTYSVARRRAVTHLILRTTPFKNRIGFSVNSQSAHWVGNDPVPELGSDTESRALAESFVADFRAKKQPISRTNRPAPTLRKLAILLELIRLRLTGEERYMVSMDPFWRARRYMIAYLKSRLMVPIYQKAGAGEPYIFYPVHAWYDSAITVRAPQFLHQHHLISALSDALPQGYKLHVKEHPITIGRNPSAAMISIARNKNVVLLDPRISSHQILERASAVVVISSTAGFEALAYHKPVVVLGQPFYTGAGVTFDVENLFDLRAVIRNALRATPREEELDSFIYGTYLASLPGSNITPGGDMEATADSLVRFVGQKMNVVAEG